MLHIQSISKIHEIAVQMIFSDVYHQILRPENFNMNELKWIQFILNIFFYMEIYQLSWDKFTEIVENLMSTF